MRNNTKDMIIVPGSVPGILAAVIVPFGGFLPPDTLFQNMR